MNKYFDLPGTFFFSLIGAAVSFGFGLIPILGIALAFVAQIPLGFGLGYVFLPSASRVLVALFTLAGFWLGTRLGSYGSDHVIVYTAILFSALPFFWGYKMGCRWAVEEESRDSFAGE